MVGKYTWIPNDSIESPFTSRELFNAVLECMANAVDYVYMLDNVHRLTLRELRKKVSTMPTEERQLIRLVRDRVAQAMKLLVDMQIEMDVKV